MATYGTRSEQDRLGKRDVNRSRSSRRSEGESLVVVNVGRNLLRLYWAGLLNSTVCAGGFFSCVDGSLKGYAVQHVVRAIPGRYQNVERFSGSMAVCVYVDRAVVTRDITRR